MKQPISLAICVLLLIQCGFDSSTMDGGQCLDGNWDFAYRDTFTTEIPPLPTDDVFTAQMPVPAYWDDHLESLHNSPFNPSLKYYDGHRPVDFTTVKRERLGYRTSALPYLRGVGYYRRSFELKEDDPSREVTLHIGAASQEAWVWLNGEYLGYHWGHATPFQFDITPGVLCDQENELIIAVSNLSNYAGGFAMSGYKGRSAGIHQSVTLRESGTVQIRDLYVYPDELLDKLTWQVDLRYRQLAPGTILTWQVREIDGRHVLLEGGRSIESRNMTWQSSTGSMEPWQPGDPRLYELEVEVLRDDTLLDSHRQYFGLRRLTRDGIDLKLNGTPIYLRGITDHCYWAETCTPPLKKETYLEIIRRLQEVGFNWIRFHTWIPNTAYLEAADEQGMLMMVEAPESFGPDQWAEVFELCRIHPAVVLYSGGNEQHLDEDKIETLAELAAQQKALVPDALFNPQEALRGVEYWWRLSDLGNDTTHTPFVHNPARLARLREFSDVFGQYGWGYLSYWSEWGDPELLDQRLVVYERPCLSHEVGIKGNTINLDHEQRMARTRIGAERFVSARKNLEQAGVLDRAETYYKNSVAWLHTFRKQAIETVRRTRYYRGYDFLGGHDHNQIGGGYEAGFLNEFFEFKPGDSAKDFLRYNAATVLLLDVGPERNLTMGDTCSYPLRLSHFGPHIIQNARVVWTLQGKSGMTYGNGTFPVPAIEPGQILLLDTLTFQVPDLAMPEHLSLQVEMTGLDRSVRNDWDFWVFPDLAMTDWKSASRTGLRVVNTLDGAALQALNSGETVLLLGDDVLPSHDLDYSIGLAGRTHGNLATVIAEHPILTHFPHEGWASWQFRDLFMDTSTVVFENDLPFDPIVEVVSSYKYVIKQSTLFEYRVGPGRLIVCTLNFKGLDPAGVFLFDELLRYAGDPQKHAVCPELPLDQLKDLLRAGGRDADYFNFAPADSIGENQRGNLDLLN